MERPSKRHVLLLCCWVLGATLVGRSFTALDPEPTDARLFAYIGLKWTQGHIPYIDIWDHKPPGIFAINALAFLLFPKSFTALACLEGLFILGCIGTVYALTQRCGFPWLAVLLTTGATAVAANLSYYNAHGNFPEVYLLWPITLSMYCFARAAPTFQGTWVFLAGVCTGVAFLFKPTGLSPFLAQTSWMLLLWAVFQRCSWRHVLASVLANGLGVFVAWLPCAIYFWQHNALTELVNAALLYNIHYGIASQGSLWQVWSIPFSLIASLQPLASLVVSIVLGLVIYGLPGPAAQQTPASAAQGAPRTHPLWSLVLLWVLFDLMGALAGGRNYRHYFLVLAPSLAVAAGFTYWSLIAKLPHEGRSWGSKKLILVFIVGPLLVAQAPDVGQAMRWALLSPERPANNPWEMVARHLQAIHGPADTLFTWDYLPAIYFATGMNNAMRHLDPHYIYDFPASYKIYGQEILQALQRSPPTFIVGAWPAVSDGPPETRDPVYRRFREVLEEQYILIYMAEDFRLYKYRGSGKASDTQTHGGTDHLGDTGGDQSIQSSVYQGP